MIVGWYFTKKFVIWSVIINGSGGKNIKKLTRGVKTFHPNLWGKMRVKLKGSNSVIYSE